MSGPQEVQYGKLPPVNAPVVFGSVPATSETKASVPGESAPAHLDAGLPPGDQQTGGVVAEDQGGDPVPARRTRKA